MRTRRWAAPAAVAVTAALFIPGTAGASPGGGQGPPGSRAPGWLAAKQQALAGFQAPPPAQVTLTPATPGPSWTAEKVRAVVMVGPGRATACTVVGELLVPDGAAAAHSQPAVMDTNGFGGSWTSSTALPLAQMAATDGYVALTYSGLGFGGSGCQIELDSPTWDGAAASQLVSWLGTLPEVSKDGADDPRVGMVGGSYGGGVQFSAAAVDPRIDAIVPVITWNDLAYSLAPDNLAFTGPTRPTTEPGVLKWEWASLFFGDGMATPLEHPTAPYSAGDCPDFDPAVCQAYVTTVALGYPDRATVTLLRHDSMVDFWSRLHLPVLLAQGEDDSLFTIQEAVDNYRELSAAGDPVQLVLQSWGHSGSTPAPGELSYAAPYSGYENALIADFFARWLRGQSVSTGAPVQYFRPWVPYQGTAAPAYGTASGWPVAPGTDLYLSGGGPGAAGALVASAGAVVPGSQTFVNPPGGIGTSYSETSAVQGTAPFSTVPPTDAPGTFASWTSAPLTATTDVVGIPTLSVSLSASVPAGVTPSTDPVVVAKLYGVAPTGALTLVDRLVAPVRLASTGGRVTITLPGIVHRYGAGDRLELVLAAGDDAYLGNRTADAYTVAVSAADPPVLSLPVVRGTQEQAGGPPPAGA